MRTLPRLSVLGPMAIAVFLVLVGMTHAGLVVAVVGVAQVVIGLVPRLDKATDSGVRSATHLVTLTIGVLISAPTAFMVFAVGTILRVGGIDLLAQGAGPSAWTSRSNRDVRTGAPRTFQPQPQPQPADRLPALRSSRRGIVLATVVMLSAAAIVQQRSARHEPAPATSTVPALRSQPQQRLMQSEDGVAFASMLPDATLGWRLPDRLDGTVVSVVDGHRRSSTPSRHGAVVWMFGGSALFGSGQRDAHTISSVLARDAQAGDTPIRVVNWGVYAYTSAQESLAFRRALTSTGPPDLVVFYDGYNDVETGMGAMLSGLPGRSQVIAPLPVLQRGQLMQTGDGKRSASTADDIDGTIGAYTDAMSAARSAADARGIEMIQFWQPNAFTRRPTADELRTLSTLGYDPFLRSAHEELHRRVRARLPANVIDLSDVLDQAPTVFIDQVHTNETGARLVGDAIARHLRSRLVKLKAAQR